MNLSTIITKYRCRCGSVCNEYGYENAILSHLRYQQKVEVTIMMILNLITNSYSVFTNPHFYNTDGEKLFLLELI